MITSIVDYLNKNLDPDDFRIGGKADDLAIDKAEQILNVYFSEEYKRFLKEVGWLEIYNNYFFGIPSDIESDEGSVVRMTLFARKQWGLQNKYIVIYSSEDEVLWCMDGSSHKTKEHIVAFDTTSQRITGNVAESYWDVLSEQV